MVLSAKICRSCFQLVNSFLNTFCCCFTGSTLDMTSRYDVPSTKTNHKKREETDSTVVDEMRCRDIVTSVDQERARPNQTFSFQDLPFDCKVSIFSYLTVQERGRVGLVCMEWNAVASTPSLWNDVDLTKFSLLCDCSCQHCAGKACYKLYKARIEKYLDHVIRIRPNVRRLRFAFDIADSQDMWLTVLNRFLSSVRIQDLKVAQLNWKETPAKSFPRGKVTRTTHGSNDLRYHCRRRQRQFAAFFDRFTASATKVSSISLPFDWSSTSICALGRLKYLEMLELDSYFVPQPKFEQNSLDEVLASVPKLKHLTMAVCLGTGLEIFTFRIAARKLEYLNLTGCAGLCIVEAKLPNLKELWVNNLIPAGHIPIDNELCKTSRPIPCLYQILCLGTPKLHCINGHRLHKDWGKNRNNKLENILMGICPCVIHKSMSMATLQYRL